MCRWGTEAAGGTAAEVDLWSEWVCQSRLRRPPWVRRSSEAHRLQLRCIWLGRDGTPHRPVALAGWGDLPGELHREILRLVPLSDAKAARGVSREMRDEVDEVWRAWGIRATEEDRQKDIRSDARYLLRRDCLLNVSPLVVCVHNGSHAHHLASMGLWWLALLVAEEPDMNGMSWAVGDEPDVDQSPLVVAVRARRPVGRRANGRVEWAHALGDEEVARMVRVAVAMGADVNRRLQGAWPLMSYCAARGCVEAVKACLAAGAEVDARGGAPYDWETALVRAGLEGHEAVVEALLKAGASAKVGRDGWDHTLPWVCEGCRRRASCVGWLRPVQT